MFCSTKEGDVCTAPPCRQRVRLNSDHPGHTPSHKRDHCADSYSNTNKSKKHILIRYNAIKI